MKRGIPKASISVSHAGSKKVITVKASNGKKDRNCHAAHTDEVRLEDWECDLK